MGSLSWKAANNQPSSSASRSACWIWGMRSAIMASSYSAPGADEQLSLLVGDVPVSQFARYARSSGVSG